MGGRVANLLRSHGFFVIWNEDLLTAVWNGDLLTAVSVFGHVSKVHSDSLRTEWRL